MKKAFSLLHIKDFSDSAREVRGIATTPTVDRVGDTIDPLGVTFAAEIPLLWQHTHESPVGVARLGQPTPEGVPFEAEVAQIDEDGEFKTLTDKAWHGVKYGLVRAVSIGFSAFEDAMERTRTGWHFAKVEIHELSLVTIPANSEALITAVRSLCQDGNPALGEQVVETVRRSVGGSAQQKFVVIPLTK